MSIIQVSPNNAFSRYARISPMTRAEERKRARLKVEVGVRLALEARQRVEEEHAWLEAEEEARLVEDARQEAKENEHAQLKVVEGVRLAL